MNLTIHKFPVQPGRFVLQLPRDAKVLTAQMQGDDPQMWVLLDKTAWKTERHFSIIGTGHVVEIDSATRLDYINTFQMGPMVWHLFEVKP